MFMPPFILAFVYQRHANEIRFATENERRWIEELREADGKLNESLVSFQYQMSNVCSFSPPRALISLSQY